ncbi:hypothetical protein FACS1894152_4590 [Bacilli bacterium]|nr:hypothetical protein FACS1894152_4590 [Bacilli bacterium]
MFAMKEEFATINFNSPGLEKRFIRTMEILGRNPGKTIFASSKNRAEAKA